MLIIAFLSNRGARRTRARPNIALEPTAYSFGFAYASGGGSPRALGPYTSCTQAGMARQEHQDRTGEDHHPKTEGSRQHTPRQKGQDKALKTKRPRPMTAVLPAHPAGRARASTGGAQQAANTGPNTYEDSLCQ